LLVQLAIQNGHNIKDTDKSKITEYGICVPFHYYTYQFIWLPGCDMKPHFLWFPAAMVKVLWHTNYTWR